MFIALSPSYTVRNEGNYSFLTRLESMIDATHDDFSAFCIPPFMGYILAHIGDDEYTKSIEIISKILNVSFEAIKNFTDQLIDNPGKKEFRYSDTQSVILPSYLLCDCPNKPFSNVYENENFNPIASYEIGRPLVPLYANFMVTTACTTDCIYCYAKRTLNPVLDTERIVEVIKELHDQGTVNLMLTGGDIFAHKDWPIILGAAREYGYKPYLSTKTPLDRDQIKLLKEYGYDELQFSLDSTDTHGLKTLINVDTDYLNRVYSFLKDCSELNLKVIIRSVLTKINASKEQVCNLYSFISQFDCVKEWTLTPAFFSKYKEQYYKSLEVDNEDLIDAYKFTQKKDLLFPISLNKISKEGYVLQRFKNVEEFVCKNQICIANTTGISILANGDCSVCEMLYDTPEYILGNVNQNSILEIWNSSKALSLYNVQQKDVPKSSACSQCSVFEQCRNDYGKRICYSDIAKSGHSKWDPDPRCPHAEKMNIIL